MLTDLLDKPLPAINLRSHRYHQPWFDVQCVREMRNLYILRKIIGIATGDIRAVNRAYSRHWLPIHYRIVFKIALIKCYTMTTANPAPLNHLVHRRYIADRNSIVIPKSTEVFLMSLRPSGMIHLLIYLSDRNQLWSFQASTEDPFLQGNL